MIPNLRPQLPAATPAALRTVPVGTRIRVIHYRWPHRANGLRRVVIVHADCWALATDDPRSSIIWSPRWSACHLAFDATGFTVTLKGEARPLCRYEWVDATP